MRIAFFTEAYDPFTNGVVVLVKAYRDALERAGHEVVIFTPDHEDRPALEDGVVRMPSFTLVKDLYPVVFPFAKPAKQFDPEAFDVLHSHHPFSCGLLAEQLAKKHDLPLVYTFHTLLTTQNQYVPGPKALSEKTLLQVIRRHCNRADCVTVSTKVMENWLRKNRIRTPIQLVRPNVPPLDATAGARERIHTKFGIKDGTVLAFCAARLSPEKGLDMLLDAIARVPKDLPFRLLLAGSGVEEEKLKARARQLRLGSRLVFAGEIPHSEMADYYAAADFFAFPSRNDTLGMVLLEALSMGLPCVGINQNGPAEVIQPDVNGLLTEYDPVSFSMAMIRMIADRGLRQRLADNAIPSCRTFCTPDTATGLLKAYETAQRINSLDRELKKKRPTKSKIGSSGPRVW